MSGSLDDRVREAEKLAEKEKVLAAEVSERKGLHGKYHGLRRTIDDSEAEGWYFVIREDDLHGQKALLAYADSCEAENPELAADLRRGVREERLVVGLYDAQWER